MKTSKSNDTSIVLRFTMWHSLQMLFSYLLVNIIITILFAGTLFYKAEHYISKRAMVLTGNMLLVESTPDGIALPKFLRGVFPDNTKDSIRLLETDKNSKTFWQKAYTVKYTVWIPYENGYHMIEYDMGSNIGLFLKLFIVLLLFELLSLIMGIGKGYKAMKRTLAPIASLAETAKNINVSQANNPHLMRDLAGKIDSINASRLDTRVSVRSTQKEMKDLADAINGMLDRINEAYLSQMRFVSDASHELRTPIAVIQGYANLLDRWGKNDEKALEESIAAIKSEAESMKELINQLLFLARGDNHSIKLCMEKTNISTLASEIMRETAMIDPGHEYGFDIQDDCYIMGDAQLIKQMIRIFIDNAIKYTPIGEEIYVGVLKEDSFVKIAVRDYGIGIDAADLPYVLDRFYRSDGSRARKTGGAGLGLSIAKWIIERHGGSIEIISRKEIGTKITILLQSLPEEGHSLKTD
jgi:two-component system sensor histidine kinase ArlS